MATRKFALNTEPHEAQIGDRLTLQFEPEVMGDEFMDAYAQLREAQSGLPADPGAMQDVEPAAVRDAANGLRHFLASFMVPQSAREFADTKLPDRILLELFHWVLELYGGAARPTGSSSASSSPSPTAGTRSTGNSRSRASTSTRGR
jgi:hypothetical protein